MHICLSLIALSEEELREGGRDTRSYRAHCFSNFSILFLFSLHSAQGQASYISIKRFIVKSLSQTRPR